MSVSMSETSKCSLSDCQRPSHVSCHDCHSSFCREHLFEHSILTRLQLNPLIDDVNQMHDTFKGLDRTDLFRSTRAKLEEWRRQAHESIDAYFTKKNKILNKFLDQKLADYDKELTDIQKRIETYKHEQETTHEQINLLAFRIQSLQKYINKLNDRTLSVYTKPLVIDENLIMFDENFNVSALSPVHRMIDRDDDNYASIAASDEHLLLYHEGTLLLVDRNLSTYKQIAWTHGQIYDMCYSKTLKRFLILIQNDFLVLNDVDMNLTKIHTNPWQNWFSFACSETFLYLTRRVYNSSLIQFNLKPSFTFCKNWESDDICAQDEGIDSICCQNNTLALMVSNDEKKLVRLDLRFIMTMNRIWTLTLDIIYSPRHAFRFCSINSNELLVADHTNSQLIQITRDGKIKTVAKYPLPPCCVIEMGKDMLVVSTESVVNFHRL